jgi:hypothetical protein
MDEGDLLSEYSQVTAYDFSTDGYAFSIIAADNSMTAGLVYRFKYIASNALGWSDFSNSLMVGLGPKPSKLLAPSKSLIEASNSPTSIMMEWDVLLAETLKVTQSTLYMDDGYGVTYTLVYEGQST